MFHIKIGFFGLCATCATWTLSYLGKFPFTIKEGFGHVMANAIDDPDIWRQILISRNISKKNDYISLKFINGKPIHLFSISVELESENVCLCVSRVPSKLWGRLDTSKMVRFD